MYCPTCGTQALDAARFCVNCGGALPSTSPEAPTAPIASTAAPPAYAGFWRRVVAALLDGVLLLALTVAFMQLFPTTFERDLTGNPTLVFAALGLLYYWALEASPLQGTLGKRLGGLRVLTIDGGRAGVLRVVSRTLMKFLSAIVLGIGFLLPMWTGRRQALHDLLTRSIVVAGPVAAARAPLPPGPAKALGPLYGSVAFVMMLLVGGTLFMAIAMPDTLGDGLSYVRSRGHDDPPAYGRRVKLPRHGRHAAAGAP